MTMTKAYRLELRVIHLLYLRNGVLLDCRECMAAFWPSWIHIIECQYGSQQELELMTIGFLYSIIEDGPNHRLRTLQTSFLKKQF